MDYDNQTARLLDVHGLTEPALAAILGVSRPSVARWRAGRRPDGAARTLLALLARHPELVEEMRAMVDGAESARG